MPQTFRLTAHQILSRYLRQAALAVLAGLAGVTWSAHAQTVTHATAATAQAPVLLRVVGGLGNVAQFRDFEEPFWRNELP